MRAFDLLLQVAWCGVEKKYQDTSSRPDTEIENWELEPRQKEWSWTSTRGVPGSSSGSRSEDGVSTNNSIRRISGAQRKIWKDRKKKKKRSSLPGDINLLRKPRASLPPSPGGKTNTPDHGFRKETRSKDPLLPRILAMREQLWERYGTKVQPN
jgi:hypothetical protein